MKSKNQHVRVISKTTIFLTAVFIGIILNTIFIDDFLALNLETKIIVILTILNGLYIISLLGFYVTHKKQPYNQFEKGFFLIFDNITYIFLLTIVVLSVIFLISLYLLISINMMFYNNVDQVISSINRQDIIKTLEIASTIFLSVSLLFFSVVVYSKNEK